MYLFISLLLFPASSPVFAEANQISGDWDQGRFLFSGNWQGFLADLHDPDNPQPGPVWQTLSLLDELKRQHPETVTISVGNIFSNQSPCSLLLNGEMEESLERLCRFDAVTLGPQDFSLIRTWKQLPDHFFDRIWTNVIPEPGMQTFPGHRIIRKNAMTLGIGSLISKESLTDSPLFNLSGYKVEDPARALRRMRLEAGPVDLLIVVCHMNRQALRKLMALADGKTRFVLVPTEPLKERELQRMLTNKNPQAWLMPDGTRQLLSVQMEKRLGGRIQEKLHRLSIEGYTLQTRASHGGQNPKNRDGVSTFVSEARLLRIARNDVARDLSLRGAAATKQSQKHRDSCQPTSQGNRRSSTFPTFPIMASRLKKIWYQPIRVVLPPEVAAATPFSFRSGIHAKVARSFTRSDAAIIRLSSTDGARARNRPDGEAFSGLSPEPLQDEQVITCGGLIQTIQPDFIRTYVFSGPKLLALLNFFAGRAQANVSIGVSGFAMTFSGNMLTGCKIRGKSIDENSEFRVTLNSQIYQDPILADLFAKAKQVGDCGRTMWDAWLQELPSLPLSTRITKKD